MHHCIQHLLVAARHQAESTQDLKDGHLGLDVVRAEALRDGVDPGDVSQHVGSASLSRESVREIFIIVISDKSYRVVHQRLDTAEGHGVDV